MRIPPFAETDWQDVRAIAIADANPVLHQLPAQLEYVPVYAQAGIAGAMRTCYLRAEVIERLLHAAKALAQQGYSLQILDGWRPPAVQQALYDEIFHELILRHPEDNDAERHARAQHFVSLPSVHPAHPSPHLTGGSVDVTLARDGQALDMGSYFDEPTRRSYSDAYEQENSAIRTHRRALYHAMCRAGFTNLPSEWWHYDFGNQNWAHFSGKTQAQFGLVWPDGWK